MILFDISNILIHMNIMKIVSNNLRALRLARGWSISELERRSGVAKGTISQLESGYGNPTVATLWSLASALSVPFSDLIQTAKETESVHESPVLAEPSGTTRFVDRVTMEGMIEIYEMVLSKDDERVSEAHPLGIMEHILVVQGRMEVGPIGQEIALNPGSYTTFPGYVRHVYRSLDEEARAVLWLVYPSIRAGHEGEGATL
ncbi:helix-turn-helix domain-containing protein [Alicyclobacillus acidocaldarius]|uniref:Transcriptional regulator, XRE family n=1 Tax=Alicyclobacillus acidocaldarius subsp. acidocaldarius (strain ATCC 27009 / DSM 446 / BCRC 14685 / JCM 5260 / KCTC 1825 / NBRC 15652 / NCIMB 11725 / NRRL B-14509 / 104-IA) TaxID=521098 RepID=C8WYG8_ALIAD|nr:XRE family transcriptional regulator [Alicyclobacillus acidocaldarius]ACV60062.1 transcriptional regulator, XRE family [Alicyclobacillus acidocaldarius subsp. acidocaldarius DSM 446]